MTDRIRVGIGGWTFEPWRDNFYPAGLPHSRELHHASRVMTAIEVNGTYYSTFKANTFAKWRDETPEGFVFSLKANRFATNRRELAGAGESIQRFVGSGIEELGAKLGPLLWQMMPTKQFDAADLEAFLKLLPREVGGLPLRHVIDARHASFATEQYLDLLEKYEATTVYADSPKFPAIPNARSGLAYLRLMDAQPDIPTGYAPEALEPWAEGARKWVAQSAKHQAFVFFINGAKERAPAAAQAFLGMLK